MSGCPRPEARARAGSGAAAGLVLLGLLAPVGVLAGGCAPATAFETAAGAAVTLRHARRVWIDDALSRTGTLASGESDAEQPADVTEQLRSAVRRVRGLELAPSREDADLVLYFEQADRLRCWRCRQPENRWYWWGVVRDAAGHELVMLHGETTAGSQAPVRRFVAALETLARGKRDGMRDGMMVRR